MSRASKSDFATLILEHGGNPYPGSDLWETSDRSFQIDYYLSSYLQQLSIACQRHDPQRRQ